jgi:glutamate synthase domain-containing protein 2
METFILTILALLTGAFIYDKYVQRRHQLLINYPIIGRFRYFFEAIREPFRQYFGDEHFYESKDKVDWVYSAARGQPTFASFSPTQSQPNPKFLIKHSNMPLNEDEVNENFSVIFGKNRKKPYKSKSIIARSAMSDGAISPEGTKAFTRGAYDGKFAINTGEGSLTTNFFYTHKSYNDRYMEIVEIGGLNKIIYYILRKMFNPYLSIKFLRRRLLKKCEFDTYIFDYDRLRFFRPNWSAPLKYFPKNVPDDMPDIIFQISSGLYGVRDKKGNFSPTKYKKIMSFSKMTEIKLAQGAKQTGGKLNSEKVTESVAYFRGVKPYKSIISPNRFPYASTIPRLFDFIAKLQKLSKKPVGIKIVVSSQDCIEEIAVEIRKRKSNSEGGIPDFITVDGGDGGSATAPLFLMDRVGLHIKDAIHITNSVLSTYNVRDEVKIIASSKILTPDDIIIVLALGADFVNIARAFMMSAGCIRARMCSGSGSHQCPVGLATQNDKLRSSYLIHKHSKKVTSYHNNLLKGVKTILAIMGINSIDKLTKDHLTFVDKNGFIYTNVNRYFDKKIDFIDN